MRAVSRHHHTGRTLQHWFGHIAWIALLCLSMTACRSGDESPDATIRAMIDRAEVFAETKDLGGLKDLLSDAYRDRAGQDKRAILGLLFVQFRRHESIHLLTRIERIELQPTQAVVTVFVAMAGRPILSASALPELRADLYRFDLTLALENTVWRVTNSGWRPAALTDFFSSETAD